MNNTIRDRIIVALIPPACPFARNFNFFGAIKFSIPPLCKLNPYYDRLMEMRFNALNRLSSSQQSCVDEGR